MIGVGVVGIQLGIAETKNIKAMLANISIISSLNFITRDIFFALKLYICSGLELCLNKWKGGGGLLSIVEKLELISYTYS